MSGEGMQTECPSCHTVFAVSDEDLSVAGGRVRCGDCLSVFDATANQHIDEDAGQAPGVIPFPMASAPEQAEDAVIAIADEIEDAENAIVSTPNEPEASIEPTSAEPIDTIDSITPETDNLIDSVPDEVEDAVASMPDEIASELTKYPADDDLWIDSNDNLETPSESASTSEQHSEAPFEPTSNATPEDAGSTIHYDDSGMFRFSDDTPQERLDEELKALVGDTPTTSEDFSASADVGEQAITGDDSPLLFGSTYASEDWDDLLREVGEDTAETGDSAALDFEFAGTDTATPSASLDLDLTRADEVAENNNADLAPDDAHEHVSFSDLDAEAEAEAQSEPESIEEIALDSHAAEIFEPQTEDSPPPIDLDAEVDGAEDESDGGDVFDQDALADILSASQIFLVDDDEAEQANTEEPAEELAEAPHVETDIAETATADSDPRLNQESSGEYAAIVDAINDDAMRAEEFSDEVADAEPSEPASLEIVEAGSDLDDSDDDEPANDDVVIDKNSPEDDIVSSDVYDAGDNASDEAAGEEIVLQSKPVTPITEGQFANASPEDMFAESMILSAPHIDPRRRLWTGLSLLLILVLAVQGIHMKRGHLATLPTWSGPVTKVYNLIGMPITPEWDIRAMCIQRSGSSLGDAVLDIETLFTNSADRAMPLPVVKVDITDNFEDVIATTIVAPKDYLPQTQASKTMLDPGRQQQANMTLAYAESRADKFELSLCYVGSGDDLRCGADICGNP